MPSAEFAEGPQIIASHDAGETVTRWRCRMVEHLVVGAEMMMSPFSAGPSPSAHDWLGFDAERGAGQVGDCLLTRSFGRGGSSPRGRPAAGPHPGMHRARAGAVDDDLLAFAMSAGTTLAKWSTAVVMKTTSATIRLVFPSAP
jgi:hypothetical protein